MTFTRPSRYLHDLHGGFTRTLTELHGGSRFERKSTFTLPSRPSRDPSRMPPPSFLKGGLRGVGAEAEVFVMTTTTFLAARQQPCQSWTEGGYCGWPQTIRFMNGWFCLWHAPDSNEGGTVMTLPTWLQQRLGKPSKRRGAKATKCIKCFKPILVGMSEDVAAHLALVDPVALSPLGEALALIDGRKTYHLDKCDQGLALWQRDRWQISGHVAGPNWIIVADHKCESTAQFPSVEVPLFVSQTGPVLDNDPPF